MCLLCSKNCQVVQIHKTIQLINEHGENFEIEKINIDQGKNFIIKTNIVAEVETTFKNINIIKQIECEAILPKQKNNNYFNIVETKIVSVENFEKS